MDEPQQDTLENQIVHLSKKLEELREYLTGEVSKEDEHQPAIVDRLQMKVGRCISAAVEIEKHIRRLS